MPPPAQRPVNEDPASPTAERVVAATRRWLEQAVIGLDLCPFARSTYAGGRLRLRVSEARDAEALLADLAEELALLRDADPQTVETTLLIHPYVLRDFLDYNDFLDVADAALQALGLEGEIQIASFHPDYRFADADADDVTHATNRSPYPTLHLLRQASVDRAVAAVPDTAAIYRNNLATMRRLGHDGWRRLLASILSARDEADGR